MPFFPEFGTIKLMDVLIFYIKGGCLILCIAKTRIRQLFGESTERCSIGFKNVHRDYGVFGWKNMEKTGENRPCGFAFPVEKRPDTGCTS